MRTRGERRIGGVSLARSACLFSVRVRRLPLAVVAAALVLAALVGLKAASAAGLNFVVNSTADASDRSIGDGVCATGAGVCTLRAAIQEANALTGHDTIVVPAGVYELAIPTLNDDLPGTGDWDVFDSVTITGAGAGSTILDGGFPLPGANPEARGIDRLFEIHPSAGNVTFSNLTLREGFSPDDGGAIQNWSSALVRLDSVQVRDNFATGVGGGINNAEPSEYEWPIEPPIYPKSGRVEIVNSTLSGNGAGGGGAAVNNAGSGTVSILAGSNVVDNPGLMIPDPQDPEGMIPAPGVYPPDSSPIANQAEFDIVGTIRIADSTVAGNYSEQNGGGVANHGSGTLTIERSTFTRNTTEAEGGGVYAAGGLVTIAGSTISANKANEGAGIYSGGATDKVGLRSRVTIVGTTVKDNIAVAAGGGISSDGDAQVTITDVTVAGNTAGDAGGGLSNGGRAGMALSRVTFTENITNDEGGGAWVGSERLLTIKNSTFFKNKAGVAETEDGVPEPGDIPGEPSLNIAGGGGLYSESGPMEITDSTFAENTASDEGGGVSIDNFGAVTISDSVLRGNRAGTDGGGVENSGFSVTFERLLVTGNRAGVDGGGIYNSSSGQFFILDTTVERNSAQDGGGLANAPDNDLIVRRSLFLRNTARPPGISEDGDAEEGGHGGGIFSLADGDAKIENSTISGNVAATAGGGIFHDADGEVRLSNLTIWRNSAPQGGGIGVAESDFVPEIPPKANVAVIARNSIVGGSLKGGSCDWYVTSEGGNLDTGGTQELPPMGEGMGLPPTTNCFLSSGPDSDSAATANRDRRSSTFTVDAIADNGGPTLTHALTWGSLAIDGGVGPCPETDERGTTRPQNGVCDMGAYEFVGPPPPTDSEPPDTQYLSGPIQDTLETVAFQFTGSDNLTPAEELQYECRLIENDPTEVPEPPAPWEPVPPELWWLGCSPGWQAPLIEEGMHTFEVRAIDRAGNVDPTPAVHIIAGADTSPPETLIAEKPLAVSNSRTATFTFSGVDNLTPPQFLEYECRLDSRDPELWLECFNPTIFTNLTSGTHTLEVRAMDGNENMDPTPARYTWTVGQLPNCDAANITLTAVADGWVDEVNLLENYLFATELTVRSGAAGDPDAVPPEPVVGQNARALFRFAVPNDLSECELESATLKLYNESPTDGRTLEAIPLGATWKESTLTWNNQPARLPGSDPVASAALEGYQEWNVLSHVQAMLESGVNHGWQIRDANENDPDGGDQAFVSREMPQDPPPATLPQLVLRYEADGSPPPPPPAAPTGPATTVYCGQVLKESTLVANDLLGCLGEGLVVGAPNIVVDLGGHKITSGIVVEAGEEGGLIAGVRNSGHTNVVIRNGTVRGFGYGVLLTGGTTRNVVEDMTLDGNLLAGIELNDADDGRNGNTIRDNVLTSNGEAAISFVNGAENSVIAGNTLEGNGGVAFQLIEANGHRFENNTVSGIPLNPAIDSDAGANLEGSSDNVFLNNTFSDFGDAGIHMTQGSQRNRVEGNTLQRSGDAGVSIQDSARNQVIDNVAHGSSDGGVVINQGNDTVVRGNDLRFNPSGVEASNSNGLVIEDNDASNSLQTGLEIGNGINIRIVGNVANRTGGAGISMEGGAFDQFGNAVGGAHIEGNTANENAESGITAADGGHTIKGNNAHNNAGFGISVGEAPDPGEPAGPPNPAANIDGGGNVASGNGELVQCAGVVCATGDGVPVTPPDTAAPDTEITGHPLTPTSSNAATFAFTGNDGPGGTPPTAMIFECRLDAPADPVPVPEEPDPEPPNPGEPPDPPDPVDPGNWIECLSPVHYHGLEEGLHHFEVRARDASDNVDLSPERFEWDIDPTAENEESGPDAIAPETRITVAPAVETTEPSATFRYAGSDNATPGLSLTFECRLDSGAWVACTAQPKDYAGLDIGPHMFEVRAIDRTGNADQSPATHVWDVLVVPGDTTPPDTTIDTAPDHTTVSTAASFAFHSTDDPTATFECSVNMPAYQAWAACTSPKAYAGLAVGNRVFSVRAVDPAGNADPTPATYAWLVGSAPVPGTVFCGQVITHSTVVKNDLAECLWDGLVIGANGITLDLGGHTIDGKGIGAAIRNDGYDNVTIKNGIVADYDFGVMLNVGTEKNIVESLTIERNQEAGIALGNLPPVDPNLPQPEDPPPTFQSGVKGNILRDNDVTANELGIWLTNNTRDTVIRDNSLQANGKQGVWIDRSHGSRVEGNEINRSGDVAISLQGSNDNVLVSNELIENSGGGIVLGITEVGTVGVPSENNRVEKNTILESGGVAIDVIWSDGNELLDNEAHFTNGEAVTLYNARDTLVLGNDLRSNKSGISLKNSSNNKLEANDASESESTGISIADLSMSNTVLKNVSSYNDGDGIYIGDELSGGSGSWIEGNTTSNNKGYGLFVPKVSHTIKANSANDNGGWGIWASEGSNGRVNIDAGGNKAQGNLGPLDPLTLKPLQCFSIRCDGGAAPRTDPIAPETQLLEAPSDPSSSGLERFVFTGTDNVSTVEFQCSLDGSPFAPCVSPLEHTLALGIHTFLVRAVDVSGNVDLTPADHTWLVEAPAPGSALVATIESGPDLTTVKTDASFEFFASRRPATLECRLDDAAFAPCTSPKSYTGLAVGEHSFRFRATDSAGNTDTAVWSWRIQPAPVAREVACGDILVQSTKLTNDLINCTGHGLIVGAHGITIDLDGHIVDGTGLDAGVLNGGYDSVTITNGVIHEFDYGVQLNPGTGLNVISSVRAELNQEAGIALADADQVGKGNTIRDNTVVSNGYGIALFSGTRNAVIRNNALGSNADDSIYIEHASGAMVEANEISAGGGGGVTLVGGGEHAILENTMDANGGTGIAVGEELLPSNGNRIERNTLTANGGGILVADSTGNQILFNVARDSLGPGVGLDLARNTLVRGNDLRSNASGIEVSESTGNRIESNNASGTLGTGIAIGALSYDNVVLLNLASQNGGEGIEVEDSAPAGQGNLIEHNTADANGGDGIGVFGVGHTIKGNGAQLNGGWGIYVAVGASDGGGNFAAGNMEPGQCFGIVCAIGEVPGAPETWIVDKPVDVDTAVPGIQTNSRNASFTYMGSDEVSPITELVFECRIDTTNDLAWEDCEYPAEILNLSAGEHVFEVRAIDSLGAGLADPTPAKFTWTYVPLPANDPPEAFIDMKPDAETWVLDAIFTFHSDEPDVTFECKVDAFGYEPCGFEEAAHMHHGAFEWSLEETDVGLHTFSVRAIDFEGNVGTPATYTWRLLGIRTTFLSGPGFTPGETPFDPPTGGPVAETTATLNFIANVADATYECSLDLEPFEPCSPPMTYSGLIVGEHLLRVIATDSEGVTELEPAEYEWEIVEAIDASPPETSIERAPASGTSSTIFEFTGTDDVTPLPLLTFECRVDSTNDLDWQACVSPFNLLDLYTYEDFQLAPGPHTFEVRAIDDAEPLDPNAPQDGNPDPTPASHTWTMVADTTPPGTGISAGPSGSTGGLEDVPFEFFGSDNATPVLELTFECSVDAAPFEACSSPESVQGLEPGEHTFRVRAVDLAGNADQSPATRTWTIVPAPVTTIVSGPTPLPPLASTSESAIFSFSANQANSTFECSLDGLEFVPCTSPHAEWVVESGSHEFEVRATNPQGVLEDTPARYEWIVELGPDVTPPNTSITSRPSNPDASSVATFEFTGSDTRTPTPNLTFECALDGTAYSSCTSPDQWSDLTRGQHTLLVRARDGAGNFDPTPASYTWTVELPPVSTIVSGPDEITESTSATFTFTSDVPGSTFECWLDGPKGPCVSPVTFDGLSGGEHIFAVLATGPAGTGELAWVEWEWEIGDITPPITTIHSGPDVETESTSASFVFSANETDVTFTCSLDGAEPRPCTSPYDIPRLHPGPHVLEVLAVSPPLYDAEGEPLEPLYDPVPAVWEWTVVDLEPPDTTIDFGPPVTTASINAYFGISSDDPTAVIECSLDNEGFSECELPAVYEDLLVGEHTLQARAIDLAGNPDPTPATYEWTIISAPANTPIGTNVTVQLPMPDHPGNATLTFFEVNGSGATTLDALTIGGALPLPHGYSQQGARFYDVSTTADFGEPVSLCIPYNPADYPDSAVRLLHFDGSFWLDVTTLNDPFAGKVCGAPESFSPFAIASGSGAAPLASIISGPPLVSNSGTATFTFWADQVDAMVLCSIDGLPFEPCTSPKTYTHLEEGDHEFMVQAVGAGMIQEIPTLYEWEIILPVDTTPPDTTITRGPGELTANFISIFEFTGVDDQTLDLELDFECSVDGGPFEGCDTLEEVEVLTAGPHTFQVRAMDLTGNVDPTPATRNWTVVDMSGPDTTVDLGPDSETESTSAIFEFSGEEELSGEPVFEFDCSLDNADFTPCSSPHEYNDLPAGPHLFQVRAIDLAGNVDPSPDFYEWLIIGPVDTTAPDTFIVAGPPPANSGPDVTFGFTSNEPVEEFECSLDGGPFEGCESVHELIGLASGDHVLRVRALDLAEIPNVDPTPAEYRWTTTGEPDTTILTGPADRSASASATFTFTSDQPGATFQCSVDGSPWVPCSSPFIAGPLIEDSHEFEVRAVNQFVNVDGEQVVDLTPASWEWTIEDISPPDTTITSMTFVGPTDFVEPNSFKFEFTGEDNRTAWFELEFECSLDGGPFEGCSMPHYIPLEELSGGAHELQVRAVDELGNVDPTPAVRTFATEGEPDTTILSGPDAEIDSTEATFTFSSDQAGATFECSLDLAPFAACLSPVTFTGVPHGEHQLEVRAKSPLGSQVDLTPAEHSWASGDLSAPVTTIQTGPAVATTDTTATFTFSADEPDVLFQCSLDGGPLTFCSSGVEYTGLIAGEHTFTVHATKPHMLAAPIPADWVWTVEDHAAPETTIVSGPPALTALDESAVFVFSSDEADATFECALDGGAFAACASPPDNRVEFDEAAGEHTLLVRAVDPSLNADATPESATWTVVAPPATAIAGPESPSASADASFMFFDQPGSAYECALDGAVFAACTSPHDVQDLANGDHLFSVRATNLLGAVEVPPAEYAWTVAVTDTMAPETTIDVRPPASTPHTSASFSFSASELDSTFECSLDGAEFAGCSSPLELVNLTVGPHAFQVQATDPAGNVDGSPAGYSWTVTEPPAPNTPIGTDVTVPVTASDGATATVSFFSVTAPGTTTMTVLETAPALPDGYVSLGASFYDIATDAAYTAPITICIGYENGDEPVRILHFEGGAWSDVTTSSDPVAEVVCGEVDSLSPFAVATGTAAVVPETTIESGPPASTVSTDADFFFSSNDPLASFECALDDPLDWGSCEVTTTFTGLLVGPHELIVRAKNPAGTYDATPARHQWTITPLPETTILSGPVDPTENRTATFTFESDQPDASFECLLDDAVSFSPCASGITYPDLPFDGHEFLVRAVDAAGNADPTPAEYSWDVGDIPPEVTIESGPGATTESRSATFVFSAPEEGLSFECQLDSGAWSPCASPKTYNGVPFGAHTFQVRVISPDAVVEPPITAYQWTITDLTVPETTIVAGPPAVSGLLEASFSFSSDEPLATFECALDGAAFAACGSPQDYSALAPGPHSFAVRALDAAGNVDQTPAARDWIVAPAAETTILTGPEAEDSPDATFTFEADQSGATFECRLDQGVWAPCLSPQTYTGLTDGEHLFEVVATNALGVRHDAPEEFGWTIEAAPPETTIISSPPATTPDTDATFSFSSNEAGVTFTCLLDGVLLFAADECLSPVTVSSLAAGAHSFEVAATDGAGKVDPTPAVYPWTVTDVTAPETAIDSGPDATTTETGASFVFSADEAGSSFECSLDGAAFASCTSPASYSGLAVGSHAFEVRATDGAGNADATPARHEWTIEQGDVVPPDTVITSPPPEPFGDGVNFRFTGTDETTAELLLTYECRLDGASPDDWAGCSSPQTLSGLALGPHRFEVRAIDEAGNVDPTPAFYEWTVVSADTTPPETTIDSGPADSNETSATFTFSSSEPDSTFSCALDGASAPCVSPVEYTGLAVGDHAFLVRAIDASGNVDATAAVHEWAIEPLDVAAPDTVITSGPADGGTSLSVSFAFEGSDPDTSALELEYQCRLDSQDPNAWVSCSSPQVYSGLTLGLHTFDVRAADPAGNVDPTPAGYAWSIAPEADTTAPETTIDGGPAGTTTDTSASFTFSANEPGSTFECSLDGAEFAGCASPQAYSVLAGGSHEFRVRATDASGNTDASSATRAWTVDTPPETTIDSGPLSSTASISATFTFSASESGATFECALDGPSFSSCASPAQYTGLAIGEHLLQVRAKDGTGNLDATPVSYGWTVTAAPETAIESGPDAATESASATFAFVTDHGVAFECALDDALFSSCSSPVTYDGLALGEHEFAVRAKDGDGNADPTPAEHSWAIGDTTPPVTSITSGPDASTASTDASFTFTVDDPDAVSQCSLDGAPFTLCASPAEYTGLAVGDHTFEVHAIKQHQLVDSVPALYDWTIVDEAAPETALVSWPDASTTSTDASFEFVGSDNAGATELDFECALDNAPFESCSSPAEYTGLAVGDHEFRVRAADAAGNVDLSSANHAWTISSPPNTPLGEDVVVQTTTPDGEPATVTFTAVSGPGSTTVELLDEPPALPGEFLQLGALFYDVETTATFTGPVTVCLGYDPDSLADPAAVALLHFENGAWVDVTGSNDPAAGLVCGDVSSLSPFAVAGADTSAPVTEITEGPNSSSSTSAIFLFTGSDGETPAPSLRFECRLDGEGEFASCGSPRAYADLIVGAHSFEVRAIDLAGNVDATPARYDWTVTPPPDTTAPTASIDSGPAEVTSDTFVTFAFSANEDGSSFECALDDAEFAACSSPHAYSGLALGEHTFQVRAIDLAGNVSVPVLQAWTVEPPPDTTPPDTSIDSGPAATTSETVASFSFSASEAGSSFECALDDAAFAACTSPGNYSGLVLGPHSFQVRAVDAAGNADATPASESWTVQPPPDVVAPDTSIDSGPATGPGTSATFTFSASEASSTFACSLDGAAFAECSSPATHSGLAVGSHTFRVQATDAAGNTDATPAEQSWTVEPPPDTVAPDTSILEGPTTPTSSTAAIFQFTGSDNVSPEPTLQFECALDGAAFAECASSYSLAGMTDGSHTFEVRAIDLAGNADPTPAAYTWLVDLTPPQTTIDSGPPTSGPGTGASFAFSAGEAGSSFECSLDGAAFASCSSPSQLNGLAVGSHTFAVRATDALGNTDATPASFSWTVVPPPDTAAPETAIGSGPAASTSSTSASFAFSADEAGSRFECALDAAAFAACTSPRGYSALAVGSHTFRVRAIDVAGNVDATPAAYTWTITPPCVGSTVTLGAQADSWLLQSSATSNYEKDSVLKVDTKSGSNARAIVRFALPAIPAGCQVVNAKLRLYASSYKDGRTLEARQVMAAWNENSVTWANQPATSTSETPPTVASGSSSGYREWLATAQVTSMYASANHGFLIRDKTENGNGVEQGFHSREKGTDNPPRLVITFG